MKSEITHSAGQVQLTITVDVAQHDDDTDWIAVDDVVREIDRRLAGMEEADPQSLQMKELKTWILNACENM